MEPLDFLAELGSDDSKVLLDTIDSLRELQVGDIVSLPQIVVVGDQSSGKSSVLEAISRVRFPVDAKLCTRFATELVLRRADDTRAAVSIRFTDSADSSDTESQQPFRRAGFDADALPSIIDEAKARMGIRKDGQKRFSRDVLRIEISRPDLYPLTLVDLPGIFHSETAEQTPADRETVNQLIDGYVRQDKSIILAVVRANNHLANQKVVEVARAHDPHRTRTVGVITKPDLAQQEGLTQQYLDLVKGLESIHKLNLGWFVLRNLSQKEKLDGVQFDLRDDHEARFFQSGEWSSVRQANRGVQSLRKGLSKVLLEHIKRSLPHLIQDIEGNINWRKERLRRLGRQRVEADELRAYLHDISKEFQRLTRDAVEGRYADEFFDLDDDARKLRAKFRKLNRAFYAVLLSKGATHEIEPDDASDGPSSSEQNGTDDKLEDDLPEYLLPVVALYRGFSDPLPIGRSEFSRELESFAADNQGRELPGIPNSDLAIHLFRKQSKPWRSIAHFHLELTLKFAKLFVEQVFGYVVGDDRNTLGAILNDYVDPFFDKKREVLEAKLDELLRPYTKGHGLPLEAEFRSTFTKTTLLRLAEHLARALEGAHPEAFEDKPKKGLSRNRVLQSVLTAADFKNGEFGTENVIDMMMTYYDVSLLSGLLPRRMCSYHLVPPDVPQNLHREHYKPGSGELPRLRPPGYFDGRHGVQDERGQAARDCFGIR